MKRLKSRGLVTVVTIAFILAVSGCGTLMHAERMHRKPSDKIDPEVVALDCAWLLVGVIPGVVALAVDFHNKTIYFSESELDAEAGDDVSIHFHGKAPVGSQVALQLLDPNDRDLVTPVQVRAAAGGQLQQSLTLTIPEDTNVDGLRLILSVNGRPQVTWRL